MALSRTTLHSSNSTAGPPHGTGAYTTSSFTPPDNSLLVAAVTAMEDSGTTDPSADITISGGGWTWTARAAIGKAASFSQGLRIFTAPVTTGASMTVSVDCGTRSIWRYVVSVVAYTGYDTGSPTGATMTSNSVPTDGAASVNLSAAPADGSEVFAALAADTGTGSTPGTGWTEIHDVVPSNDASIQTQVRAAAPGLTSFSTNALGGTATTTSFTITTPGALAAGDLMCLEFTHRGTGDGTVSDDSGDGVSWTRKGEALFAADTFTTQHYYKRCTAAMAGGGDTITVTGLTNSCAGILTVYQGVISAGDPFHDWTAQANASGTESHASVATDANEWAVLVVGNSPDLDVTPTSPLVERAERLSTGGTDTSTMHASFEDTAGGGSGALAWAQTNAASGSIGYSMLLSTDNTSAVSWADVSGSGATDILVAAVEIKEAASGTTGTVAVTQADDTSTASGQLGYSGTTAVTQADQTSTASGTVSGPVTGTVAVTQADQTSTASGQLGYSGTAAATQADQTSMASGQLGYSGPSATTQADQTSAAAGQLGYTGTFAAIQEDQAGSASGTVAGIGEISGSAAITQDDQTPTATGQLGSAGTTAASQDNQTATAAGTVINPVTGTAAATQNNQTSAAAGQLGYTGIVAATQADQIAAASGTFAIAITGLVAALQSDQTAAAVGFVGEIPIPAGRPLSVPPGSHAVDANGAVGLVAVAGHSVTATARAHTVEAQ